MFLLVSCSRKSTPRKRARASAVGVASIYIGRGGSNNLGEGQVIPPPHHCIGAPWELNWPF
jgi:hypothetical protein